MRSKDVLPDGTDQSEFKGVVVRKGTVGAFLANARLLTDATASPDARSLAERDIIDALPALRALGLFEILAIRDDRLRALVEAH
jgi:hypothetical protein